MTILMVGEKVAKYKMDYLMDEMTYIRKKGTLPRVEIIRVGQKEDARHYENAIKRKFDVLGIRHHESVFPEDVKQHEIIHFMKKTNDDPNIHGIILLRPLPKHLSEEKLTSMIAPEKDIEGTVPFNIGRLLYGEMDGLIACTPLAVMELLLYYEIMLLGANVVIVGHSSIVGKPLTMMLLNEGATVSTAHIHTKNLEEITSEADIVISATGKRGLITKKHIKNGAVVVDVGINVDQYGNVHGDVLFDEVIEKASYITPVPGGVGAVTTTMLASQVVKATKQALVKHKKS
ncbi:bifunctional 5,10-methylenetetrahydrofolate dehydrogenase/5,10-methenyltetrahydrofolate cyclohydrolase [Lentibacillus saliphilus]|uniref:bifunctional 5,10-methylenetetrahydrofolate dehydrogenase/5,10-methenyltetrahydrofolate cyclohydrolase n=1 Tax=Lentibacillus saliphilus TaxID=2737028 RepID=UPI001C2FA7B5|nr:bifunctional 5,10-methylenetetrahydrofolate dehydrogenase/5,10-methenyltetrahydrofolate cyclohydrolase [Lentibacillus saliphilus]